MVMMLRARARIPGPLFFIFPQLKLLSFFFLFHASCARAAPFLTQMSDKLPDDGEGSSGSNGDEPMATRATSDPHNLLRFVAKHGTYFSQAMAELRAGHKSSCWSWYLLPTPPFMKGGEEVGSPTNRTYALRTDAEAKAYLAFKHPTVSLLPCFISRGEGVARSRCA